VALNSAARRGVVLAAALAAAALTARLGVWQLDRAAQKSRATDLMAERAALPTLASAALARGTDDFPAQQFRRVELQGRWIADRTVFLDNRARDGVAGFVVVTPLAIGPGEAVLVQRGWVARDAADRNRTPRIVTVDGPVRVVGQVVPPPSRLFELGDAASGAIRQNVDPQAYGLEIGIPLRPLSVQQLIPEAGGDDRMARDWPAAATGPGRNQAYAFQWFSFSALIAGLYVWFQIIRPRRHVASA
jgi:surfeit locus 1 family protein